MQIKQYFVNENGVILEKCNSLKLVHLKFS